MSRNMDPKLGKVLRCVSYSGFLDMDTIVGSIRPLSKEFQEIGNDALENHPSLVEYLHDINERFTMHYCTLCNKPYVNDGSWYGISLCNCADNNNVTLNEQERLRRANLCRVKDPRLEPDFLEKSTFAQVSILANFCSEFGRHAVNFLGRREQILQMASTLPVASIDVDFFQTFFNESPMCANAVMGISTIISILQQELGSFGTANVFTNIALAAFKEEPRKVQDIINMVEDVTVLFKKLSVEETLSLCSVMNESFFSILNLQDDADKEDFVSEWKNVGNHIGEFVTAGNHGPFPFFASSTFVDKVLVVAQETFTWMPIYGGSPESFEPREYLFTNFATNEFTYRNRKFLLFLKSWKS